MVNVNTKNRQIKYKNNPWLVCLTASLFIFYEFVQMHLPNTLGVHIMKFFPINAIQLGKLAATYFCANLLFLIPAGILLDRWSVKKLIIISMCLAIIGRIFFIAPSALWLLMFGRFIIGISGAFCFLSFMKLASRWFAPNKMGMIIGLGVAVAMFGGVMAQTPFVLLLQTLGWYKTILCDVFLGVIVLLLIAYFVKDFPNEQTQPSIKSWQIEFHQLKQNLKNTFLSHQNWFCGIYSGLISQPIFLLGGLWGILYLKQVHHFPQITASYITSMIFAGAIVGTPIIGWISDKIQSRKLPMFACAIFSITLIVYIIYTTSLSITLSLLLFFLLGLFTSGQALSYPLVTEINPKEITAMAGSIVSICTIGGSGSIRVGFYGLEFILFYFNEL